MATIKPTSVPSKRLAASLTAASTSLQLNDILGWDGSALTSSDFGTKLYAVLRNDSNTQMELMELDPSTIASASITILLRGLKFTGDLTTEVTANKLTWIKNETIVELGSDTPQLLNSMVQIYNDQTITGIKTFADVPASSAAPVSSNDLVRKSYVDALALGSATADKVVVAATAGETVAAGNLLYFDETDNEWKKTDADTAATLDNVMLGIAQGAGTNGNAISGGVLILGVDTNQSGMTQGDLQYASNTAGAIASSAGTVSRVIGIARSATNLFFDPNFYYTLASAKKDALAGGGSFGTPSSSNKFVTETYISTNAAGKFGGTGADGALAVSSGTTSIDLGSAAVVVKNYTSISITGTGAIDFTNPHANGTIVILKSQGAVTITSSATRAIDLRGIGAAGGAGGVGAASAAGSDPTSLLINTNTPKGKAASTTTGGAAGAAFDFPNFYTTTVNWIYRKGIMITPGAGGASGDASSGNPTSGSGGRGGGALYVECGGALNFTGTIDSSGSDGSASSGVGGANASAGAGGGGSAGMVVILYETLTASSGTITAAGGAGGTSQAGTGVTDNGGGGGGGAGSVVAAGGAGGNVNATGAAAAGAGAGGGGGGGRDGAAAGLAGGAGGASMGGVVAANTEFD